MGLDSMYKRKPLDKPASQQIKDAIKDLDDDIKKKTALELARLEFIEEFGGMEPISDEEVIEWYNSKHYKKNKSLDDISHMRKNIEGREILLSGNGGINDPNINHSIVNNENYSNTQPGIGGNGEPNNNQNTENNISDVYKKMDELLKFLDEATKNSPPPPKYIKDSFDPNAPYRINEDYIDYLYNKKVENKSKIDYSIELGNSSLESLQKTIDEETKNSPPPPKYIKDSLDDDAPYQINDDYIDYLYSLYSNNKAEDLKRIKEIIIELEEELIELNNAAPEKAGKSL